MKKGIYLLATCLMLLVRPLAAQNVDSLFLQARTHAIEKSYELSRQELGLLLQIAPGYRDATLLYGITFLWQGKYERGVEYLDSLQKIYPEWEALFFARADGRLWGKDYSGLLQVFESIPPEVNDSLRIIWYKARAWHQMGDYQASLQFTQKLMDAQANFPNLLAIHQVNLQATRKQHVQLDYQFSSFDAAIPNWHWLSLEYGIKIGGGPMLIRGTWIERFDLQSVQAEAEWYPRLNDKTYFYGGLGIGAGPLFPAFRAGAEAFRALPHDFEISAGMRHISFTDSRINSFTLSASKYYGKFWFNVRPFVIPNAGNVYVTNTFQARRYLKGGNRWINFTYGIGNSPDMDFRLNRPDAAPSNQLFLLAANLFRLDIQWQFQNSWLVKPFFEYKNEEFLPGSFRTRYTTGTTLLISF